MINLNAKAVLALLVLSAGLQGCASQRSVETRSTNWTRSVDKVGNGAAPV